MLFFGRFLWYVENMCIFKVVLWRQFEPSNIEKSPVLICLRKCFIDTNELANMDFQTPQIITVVMVGHLSRHQFDPQMRIWPRYLTD